MDRSRSMADGGVFILPTCIDDTAEAASAGAGTVQGPAHRAPARWRTTPGIPAPPAGSLQRDTRMSLPEDTSPANPGQRRRRHRRRHPGSAESVAGPVLLHRGNPRLFPRPRRGNRRARAPRAAQAAQRAVRPVRVSARRPCCAPAWCRGCAPRVIARCTCGWIMRRSRRRLPSRSSRPSSRPRPKPGYWTQAGIAVDGESLWEFLHHRGDLLRDARWPHADAAADLRPVRGSLHPGARPTTPAACAPRQFLEDLRGPGREPPAGRAGSAHRGRRCGRRDSSISRAPITAS